MAPARDRVDLPPVTPRGLRMAPGWHKDGAKLAQDGAKMGQDGAQMAQDGAKMGQDGAKIAPR